jgi:hypothetical protein
MLNRRIECILRLINREESYVNVVSWLIDNKITTLQEAKGPTREQEKAEFLYNAFKKGVEMEKIQLLDYEWSILPLEQIRITCITDREKKEFTLGH